MTISAHPALETTAYFRAPEVARYLNISRTAAYRLIQSGALRHVRIGSSVRVSHAALLEYVARCEVAANDDTTA